MCRTRNDVAASLSVHYVIDVPHWGRKCLSLYPPASESYFTSYFTPPHPSRRALQWMCRSPNAYKMS